MNLYTISDNPVLCIQSLDDFLLTRTIVESAQLLSTAIQENEAIKVKPEGIYKSFNPSETHNVWIRESKYNYKWVFLYFIEGLKEFKRRTGKNHKAWDVSRNLMEYETYFPDIPMTPFPRKFKKELSQYDELMNMKDTFEAYRNYLNIRWDEMITEGREPSWTNCEKPSWRK